MGTAWLLKGRNRFRFSTVLAARLQKHPSCAARRGGSLPCLQLEAAACTGPREVFLQHFWPPGGPLARAPPARTVTVRELRLSYTWASQKRSHTPHTTGALLWTGRISLPWEAAQPRTTERLPLVWRGALLKIRIHFSIMNYTFLDLKLWVLVIFNTVKKITLDFRISLKYSWKQRFTVLRYRIHCTEGAGERCLL